MLVFLLRRLKWGLPAETFRIVLATTRQPQDDPVATWGETENVTVVRGAEDDVLNRYIQCLELYPSETIVRITADNPLTCPEITKWVVNEKTKKNANYVQCSNLPYGVGVDVFSSKIMHYMNQNINDPNEKEHINLHILRFPEKFKSFTIEADQDLTRPDLNMTIDTKEDWQRVGSLFKNREKNPWQLSLREAIARMDSK